MKGGTALCILKHKYCKHTNTPAHPSRKLPINQKPWCARNAHYMYTYMYVCITAQQTAAIQEQRPTAHTTMKQRAEESDCDVNWSIKLKAWVCKPAKQNSKPRKSRQRVGSLQINTPQSTCKH